MVLTCLSFSNGIDPEYAVIGRVARKIWAKALKYRYKADSRAQMLKYHIQTSGRSLHAQEIDFNDIRTTLKHYTPFMTIAILCIQMLMMKPLQHPQKSRCDGYGHSVNYQQRTGIDKE